jgi:hypothetical protein
MTEKMVSRRNLFSLLGLAAAFSFAVPTTMVTTLDAEAQAQPSAPVTPAPASTAPATSGSATSTPMINHHRTTATVTDGLGMTARPAGLCRVGTARPTKGGVLPAQLHGPGWRLRAPPGVQLVTATIAEWSARLALEAEGAFGRLATIAIVSTPPTVSLPSSDHIRNKRADD